MASPPALARATISAFEALARSRKDEKSDVLGGAKMESTTLPPSDSTASDVWVSSVCPNAWSAPRKNHRLPPSLTIVEPMTCDSAYVSYVQLAAYGEQFFPVMSVLAGPENRTSLC